MKARPHRSMQERRSGATKDGARAFSIQVLTKLWVPHPLCVLCTKGGKPQMPFWTVNTQLENALIGRFGIVVLGPNHMVVGRLLLLLEEVLEDEMTPSATACVHQRTTLAELSQLDG